MLTEDTPYNKKHNKPPINKKDNSMVINDE